MTQTYYRNPYMAKLGDFYERCPKAVLAAIAYSYASTGGDHPEGAVDRLIEEWQTLYDNGIVPQKPPRPKQTG